jgi:hypothetical protein
LKVRIVAGVKTLSLRHPDLGSFAVPGDWTDWTPPGAQARLNDWRLLVDAAGLIALADLIFSLIAGDFGLDR